MILSIIIYLFIYRGERFLDENSEAIAISLPKSIDDPLPQIMVPATSYRMGVPATGYALLTMNNEAKQMVLSMLWNPHRYTVLMLYGFSLCLTLIHLILIFIYIFVRTLLLYIIEKKNF